MLRFIRIIIMLIILVITAIGAGGYWVYEYKLKEPLPSLNEISYTIHPNMSLSKVAMELMDKELMNYPTALTWVTLARIQEKARLIKAGEYSVPVNTTPLQLLEIFVNGKTVQHAFSFPEGWNFRQLMAAIRKSPYLVHTLEGVKNEEIMAKLGYPNQHPEGQFYPDTYHFPKGTTDVEFLQRAYRVMQKTLEDVWKQKNRNLPFKTSKDALILASIIEKETGKAEERVQIAGVFVRRLQKGMLLQTDPTVIYALAEKFDGDIRKKDLRVDSPYNTYRNKGLPPTPIAMPGRDALLAAVQPAEGTELFFVAKGKGAHHFSSTLAEHECAVIAYQLKGKSSRYSTQCKRYPNCWACR